MTIETKKREDEAIVITSEEGIILTVNKFFSEITGYSLEEVIGQRPSLFKSEQHHETFYKDMWTSIIRKGFWCGHVVNVRKNGEEYSICLKIQTVIGNGSSKYFMGTFLDTTNQEDLNCIQCKDYTNQQDCTKKGNEINPYTELEKAIYNEEFMVHYQPILNIETKKVYSIEALVRWLHPTEGLISPMDFIPLAEESGLIHEIGDWVLRQSLFRIKDLHQQGFIELKIMVNISVKQILDVQFLSRLKRILTETEVEPHHLILEITENVFMEATEHILNILNEIKLLGVGITLDDFGTGYSALKYLKYFPFDSIKIDREFVSDVHHNSINAALVETMLEMAKKLNLNVIAEGIEKLEQQEFLINNSCHMMQGFLFSKPLDYQSLKKFLLSN